MTLKEYNRRRQSLTTKMLPRSAALIFAAPEVVRSAETKYPYRQNSNFWYFTGFNEPQALLILIKINSNNYFSVLFNRAHDKDAEVWTGKRLGQEAARETIGVSQVFPWEEIHNQLYLLINGLEVVYHAQEEYDFADKILFSAFYKLRYSIGYQLKAPVKIADWRPWVYEMRLIKSAEELMVMRRACRISAIAHTRAIQKCRPGMYEYQLEGELQYECKYQGSQFLAYNTIVGSGKNSCVLHYTENSQQMKDGDLVLVDAGCEYEGYASDITRTFPVNGNFLPKQLDIYNIVLSMLNYALILYSPGCSIKKVNEEVVRIMLSGLCKLGIIHGDIDVLIEKQVYRHFLMHSISHWLGLDVHDVGDYGSSEQNRILQSGMVLTVEPGVYIPDNNNMPACYRGIGVRIEDNIVITSTGNENLTDSLVKNTDLIETLMAETH